MNKNKKILFALILMIGVAIATGVLLYFYLMPKKTTVYVFNNSYSAGEEVTSDMFTTMEVDSTITVGGSETDTNNRFVTADNFKTVLNQGNYLKMNVSEGMPLTLSMLSVSGGTSVELSLGSGNVAVTINASESVGITSDVDVNSHINIYATGWDGTTGTTLIFQNMKVLAVGNDGDAISSITLEVTPEESLKLINAQNTCSLYFGVVDASRYQSVDDDLSYSQSYIEES